MHRSTTLQTWALALAVAFAVSPMALAAGECQGTSPRQPQRHHQQTARPSMAGWLMAQWGWYPLSWRYNVAGAMAISGQTV